MTKEELFSINNVDDWFEFVRMYDLYDWSVKEVTNFTKTLQVVIDTEDEGLYAMDVVCSGIDYRILEFGCPYKVRVQYVRE